MASPYTVRRATTDDIDGLLRLRELMIELVVGPAHHAALDGDTTDWRVASRTLLAEGFAAGTAVAFVAEADRRLVGGGVGTIQQRLSGPWNPTGHFGEITSMVTEPDWQHRGIAGRVLDLLLAWFVGEGLGRVELMATEAGEPLYRDRGFADRGDRAMRWLSAGA